MSNEWILFLSIFGGILAGSAVGAISLLILNIFNNYSKRKSIALDIRTEIKNNLNRIEEIAITLSSWSRSTDSLSITGRLGLSFVKLSNYIYKNYFKDLYLLADNKIKSNLHELYGIEYYFTVMDKRMFDDYPEIIKGSKNIDSDMKELKNFVDSFPSNKVHLNVEESEKFKLLIDGINEYYSKRDSFLDNKELSEKMVNFMEKTISSYILISKKLMNDLEKISEQNIFIYITRLVLSYFRKNNN